MNHSSHYSRHARGGFTLVETLVSLALFALIMSFVAGAFSQFLNNTNQMTSVMASYDGARVFSTQISNELSSAMVRVNTNRWLNLKVEENSAGDGEDGVRIFFTAPDDNLRSIRALNFISHYVYFWNKNDQALYRGVYNTATDPEVLADTGADPQNKSRAANQERLTKMTLSYRSSSPYGWTRSGEMKELMEQKPHQAIMRNVFDFQVRCYEDPKSENPDFDTAWQDPERLPLFVEIELSVAHSRMAAGLRREIEENGQLSEESRKKLRNFVITVPMRNHGINDSNIY